MKVIVNGDHRDVNDGTTVGTLLEQLGIEGAARGIAVARNGDVVIRSRWDDVVLADNDALEVLHAVQGG